MEEDGKKVLTGRPACAVASLAVMRDGDDEEEERKERGRGLDWRMKKDRET